MQRMHYRILSIVPPWMNQSPGSVCWFDEHTEPPIWNWYYRNSPNSSHIIKTFFVLTHKKDFFFMWKKKLFPPPGQKNTSYKRVFIYVQKKNFEYLSRKIPRDPFWKKKHFCHPQKRKTLHTKVSSFMYEKTSRSFLEKVLEILSSERISEVFFIHNKNINEDSFVRVFKKNGRETKPL